MFSGLLQFLIGFFVGQNAPNISLQSFFQQVVDFFTGLFGAGGGAA